MELVVKLCIEVFFPSITFSLAWMAYMVAAIQLLWAAESVWPCKHLFARVPRITGQRWFMARTAFIQVALVLVRPHNVPLAVIMSCTERLLSSTIQHQEMLPRSVNKKPPQILHFYCSSACFFQYFNMIIFKSETIRISM